MRESTGGLTAADPAIQRAATCASCRRTVAAVVFEVPIPKCAHCGGPLNEGEDGVIIDGDRFHDVCMRRLITDETIRVSCRLSRQSRELIEQSRRRLRNPESDATDYDNRTEWRAECPTDSRGPRLRLRPSLCPEQAALASASPRPRRWHAPCLLTMRRWGDQLALEATDNACRVRVLAASRDR